MTHTTRREFVRIMAYTGAATPLFAAGCASSGQPTNDVAAGNISAIPVGTLRAISSDPVAIGRDGAGLYAMSTLCTHAQCDMRSNGSVASDGMSCACHRSKFDVNGTPTGGPAQSTLPHFAVSLGSDGAVTIHQSQTVSSGTRTAAA